MEALILAGGKAERLGEAAQGLPKPLVPVAGFPLAEYTVGRLVRAGVSRVIVACRAGDEEAFVAALSGFGAEIEAIGEQEPLGRGGGLRLAASERREEGAVLAAEGKLRGYRHEGVWLTVNTPKDLRRAAEFMEEHPDWRPRRKGGRRLDGAREGAEVPAWPAPEREGAQ